MTDDLTALRALAEKATPGSWEAGDVWVYTDPIYPDDSRLSNVLGMKFSDEERATAEHARGLANAEFIAAANPTAMLALLDRLERAEAAIERVRAVLASWELVQERNREQFESGNPGMITPIDCVGGLRAALDTGKEAGE